MLNLTREAIRRSNRYLVVGYNTSWSSQYVWRGESQSSKDMSPAIGARFRPLKWVLYLGLGLAAITNGTYPMQNSIGITEDMQL